MHKLALVALLFLSCVFAQAQKLAPAPNMPAPQALSETATVSENVEYGSLNGQTLLLDVYQPGGKLDHPRPAVILIHGGGWIGFDKSTMQRMGQFLARAGFVAFSVDYRLFHGTENRWPAQLDDVQRSVRWVRANAAKYNVDPSHIGAFGHSAGAQLASLLGMLDTRDNSDPALAKYSSRVQAVVDVSGPTDFTVDHDKDGDAFLEAFLGADFAHQPDVWRDASPVFHVSKRNAPFLIVHGTQDTDIPISQAQELFDKLHEAKVQVELVKIEDGHTFRAPEARERLASETFLFFNRYLIVGQ